MSENVVPQTTLDDLSQLVSQTLTEAGRQGASAAEAAVHADLGLSVAARLGDIETLEHHKDQGLAITVYMDDRKGSASTSDLRDSSLRDAVAAACRIARYTAGDACSGLAEARLMAHDYADLALDHPWALSAEAAIDLAIQCEDAARRDPAISNSEGASVDTVRGTSVYGNSHGFVGGYSGTRHALSCAVIGSHNGSMQRDYWYTTARDAALLETAEAVGARAAERTLRRLDACSLSTRQAPVLFEAEVARSLLGHFVSAASGGSLYRNASFLVDAIGTRIFPDFVHLREEPHIEGALGSAPFDHEGVATAPRDVVREGVLQGYFLSSYSARRLGLETTANAGGVHNLIAQGGGFDRAGLLQQMDTGLMVTELIGHGVNTVTGDYSRGAAGYWVENGEIQYPVEEITIAGNLKDMFRGITAIGNDFDTRGNIRCGSILIREMTIAGE